MKQFSKKEAIKFGWTKTKENFKFLFFVMLILAAMNFIPTLFMRGFKLYQPESSFLLMLIGIIFSLITFVLYIGYLKIIIKIHDGEKTFYKDLINYTHLIFKYIVASIIYSIIVFTGFILLIVPGIYLATRFQFYLYFIADKEIGPIDALKESWKITKGSVWDLILFTSLIGVVNLLGFIALFVGLIVTVPLTTIAYTYTYRKLSQPLEIIE